MPRKTAIRRSAPLTDEELQDAAYAIYGKIERAHKHIGELHAAVERFFDNETDEIIYERDIKTGTRHVRLIEHFALPPSVSIIAGDVLHCLRSSLDHVYALLVAVNGYEIDRVDQFPIADSAKAYKDASAGVVERIGQDALKLIDALEPYKGGCDAIWRLHRLNIIDKHRALMTTGKRGQGRRLLKQMPEEPASVSGERAEPSFVQMRLPPLLKHGAILESEIPDDKAGDEVNLTIEIAIHEPGVVEAEPLIQTLDGMLEVTKRVVDVLVAAAYKRVA